MATNQTIPDWETPASAPKRSIFSSANLFSSSGPSRKSRWSSKKSPLSSAAAPATVPTDTTTTGGEKDADAIPHSEEVAAAPGTRRRFCGYSRTTCAVLFVLVLLLLALIIGLTIGLKGKGHKSTSTANLPLPTNAATFTGDITYYSDGPGYGACGYQNTSTDAICAVSHIIWDAALTSSNSNDNPLCGQMIRITRYDSTAGKNHSVDVEVVDRCVGCVAVDLDLSLSMFTDLADVSLGRTTASWAWLT